MYIKMVSEEILAQTIIRYKTGKRSNTALGGI